MRLRNISLLLLLALALGSCMHPKDLVYTGVQHFGIHTGGPEHSALHMDVALYNPNRYTLRLKKADVDVYINNKHIGMMHVNGRHLLPGLDTTALPVTLDVALKEVLPGAVQLLFNSEVDVHLTGRIRAGRHGLYVTVPVDYTGKQDIRQGLNW